VAGRPESADPVPGHSLRTVAVVSNPWGYFSFDGLAPGSYSLRASSGDLVPATSSRFDLREAEAFELREPLELRRPLRLGVEISLTGVFTELKPIVELLSWTEQGHLEEVARSEAVEGSWLSPPLAPGRYAVRVRDQREGALAWEEVDLRTDQVLTVELELVLVTGEVRLGDEPLTATVHFGGLGGVTRVIAEAVEGRFDALLPRGGEWPVVVWAEAYAIRATGLSVTVEPDPRTHEAEIEIVLPDTLVSGVVVDPEGRPVAGADVRLTTPSGRGFSATPSRPDGGFEMRGQAPGEYALQAEREGDTSEIVELTLSEEQPRHAARLVLGRSVVLRGRVSGATGGVGSAYLRALSFDAAGSMAAGVFQDATADQEGAFEMRLPAGTAWVHLYVMAPGYLFHAGRLAVGGAEPVSVHLTQSTGGRLRLPSRAAAGGRAQVVYIDGQLVPVLTLAAWADLVGAGWDGGEAEFSIPFLRAGRYVYCELDDAEIQLVVESRALPAAAACSQGLLTAGGELRLGISEREGP